MNIFVSSSDPVKSAEFLDNKRVIKMILESAQLLCTAINVNGGESPYKTTHINHPCSIWTRQSKANYMWLVEHFKALCSEYTKRYGKVHACQQYLDLFLDKSILLPDEPLSSFANCTTYKDLDVHVAYKLYLNDKWNKERSDKVYKFWRAM